MVESIRWILKDWGLIGQESTSPTEIMEWFAAGAEHWKASPSPFVWGEK